MSQQRHKSIRLLGYDYAQEGAYFITVCTYHRQCILGRIVDGDTELSTVGKAVEAEWIRTADLRKNVVLDEFVIMPNHLHAIVFIVRATSRACPEAPEGSPLRENEGPPAKPRGPAPASIPAIVAGFKSVVTSRVNQILETPGAPVWQNGYYEHVIRSERDLHDARRYVVGNPSKWELDQENPDRGRTPAVRSAASLRSGDLSAPSGQALRSPPTLHTSRRSP